MILSSEVVGEKIEGNIRCLAASCQLLKRAPFTMALPSFVSTTIALGSKFLRGGVCVATMASSDGMLTARRLDQAWALYFSSGSPPMTSEKELLANCSTFASVADFPR